MGLGLNIQNKYDGQPVQAFHIIDLVNINFLEKKAQIFGRIFASDEAFLSNRTPLDNFSFVFYDLAALLVLLPSTIEKDAYGWLKSLPEFVGAIDKQIAVSTVPEKDDPQI